MFRKFNKNSHVKGICFALLVALMSLTGLDIAVSQTLPGADKQESSNNLKNPDENDKYKDVIKGAFKDGGNYMSAVSERASASRQLNDLNNIQRIAKGKQENARKEIEKHCKGNGKKENKKCVAAQTNLSNAIAEEEGAKNKIKALDLEKILKTLSLRADYLEEKEKYEKQQKELKKKGEENKGEENKGEANTSDKKTEAGSDAKGQNPSGEPQPETPSGSTTTNSQANATNVTGCSSDYGLFSGLIKTGSDIFKGLRDLIYVVAGFGIIGVAVGGFFGNLNWKWLGAILIALVVIASTGEIINMITGCDDFSAKIITDTLK